MEEFEQKESIDEKLSMIFKVVSAQQIRCGIKVKDFEDRIDDLETSKKLTKAKLVGIGLGSGGGGAGLVALIKSWLAGGPQ